MDRDSEAHLQLIARTALDGRGHDIVALDVRELVDYMDFLLIVTGTSARRSRAIAQKIITMRKREGDVPLSRSGLVAGTWVCLDYVDVVVHIFDPETREHYDLELLWNDAERFELDLPTVSVPAGAEEDEDEIVEEGVILPPQSESGDA